MAKFNQDGTVDVKGSVSDIVNSPAFQGCMEKLQDAGLTHEQSIQFMQNTVMNMDEGKTDAEVYTAAVEETVEETGSDNIGSAILGFILNR